MSQLTPEGERNEELFQASIQMRDAGLTKRHAEELLLPCANRDGLSLGETTKTIKSVFGAEPRLPIETRSNNGRRRMTITQPLPKSQSTTIDLPPSLPRTEVPDGLLRFLDSAFEPGDQLSICAHGHNDSGKDVPASKGSLYERDSLKKRLRTERIADIVKSDPMQLTGAWVRVNPMSNNSGADSGVASFRHALIEFDTMTLEEQWAAIRESRLPCSCVIFSGGKSLHAWVRVEAASAEEYDERVRTVHNHFIDKGYAIDVKNKNASRYSRLPGIMRMGKKQTVLHLRCGHDSFMDWLLSESDTGSFVWDIGPLLSLDDKTLHADCLIGDRFLCRRGGLLINGPSGIGKSVLAVEMAVRFAVGLPFMGLRPNGELKSLYVQAENDGGDLREMMMGAIDAVSEKAIDASALAQNLKVVTNKQHSGARFIQELRKLIDRYRPDLVFIDPLLSYLGGEVNHQSTCSEFFRGWLDPLAQMTHVGWVVVHHTGKPPKVDRVKWSGQDFAYAGIGHSDITNWARAIITIGTTEKKGVFSMKFPKRGNRTGIRGAPEEIFIGHSDDGRLSWREMAIAETESEESNE